MDIYLNSFRVHTNIAAIAIIFGFHIMKHKNLLKIDSVWTKTAPNRLSIPNWPSDHALFESFLCPCSYLKQFRSYVIKCYFLHFYVHLHKAFLFYVSNPLLTNRGVRGFFWFFSENNSSKPASYLMRFGTTLADWTLLFNQALHSYH